MARRDTGLSSLPVATIDRQPPDVWQPVLGELRRRPVARNNVCCLFAAKYAGELQIDAPHPLGGDPIPAHQSDSDELTHDPRRAE